MCELEHNWRKTRLKEEEKIGIKLCKPRLEEERARPSEASVQENEADDMITRRPSQVHSKLEKMRAYVLPRRAVPFLLLHDGGRDAPGRGEGRGRWRRGLGSREAGGGVFRLYGNIYRANSKFGHLAT